MDEPDKDSGNESSTLASQEYLISAPFDTTFQIDDRIIIGANVVLDGNGLYVSHTGGETFLVIGANDAMSDRTTTYVTVKRFAPLS
jgi:hypothetical protein